MTNKSEIPPPDDLPEELDTDVQDEQAAWDKQMARKTPEQIDQMWDDLVALAEKYKVKPTK